ncbi:thiol protease/hemagglutinin PrtT [Bacteroides sp. UBA939]|uniref:thiol protease/hemagglutinin PrtT n=1 Tax=Bacteroides sp. UBA939 TaxID=1946092 RepID=UPI0025C423FC|nr:thiol protease/hemagglutinin PrtT [Bacteroides sp. UBA939]
MRYTLLFLFVLLSNALLADNISAEQAHAVATNFFKKGIQTRGITSAYLQLVWNGEDAQTRSIGNTPAFYVFNNIEGGGFVIIAGDDAVMPVLGYSFTNHFAVDGMPSNLKGWMNGLKEQINEARRVGLIASDAVSDAWRSISETVDETMVEQQYETAEWNQLSPYNTLCPEIRSVRTVTGCVATAVAILMRYHEWPETGKGTLPAYNYVANIRGTEISQAIPERTLGNVYNWNNMPLEYDGKSSEAAKAEVASLMYDCGVMAQSEFNIASAGGTSASTLAALQGLAEYMGYNKGMVCLFRDWYSEEEWIRMLKDEIRTVGPVLYGGATLKNEGHQFILDGYTTDDYFSVNWGWSGVSNGFFLISALNPDEQGVGGSSDSGFVANQDAVFGMKKMENNSDYQSLLGMFGDGPYVGLKTAEIEFKVNTTFRIGVGLIRNCGLTAYNGVVALALVGENLNVREVISEEKSINLEVYAVTVSNFTCRISSTPQPGDRIMAVYKGMNDADWKLVRGGSGTTNEIIVKDKPTSITEVEEDGKFIAFCDRQRGIVTVSLPENTCSLNVYDANGRLLKQIPTEENTNITFSCREYPAGVYILQAVTDKGTQQHKFLK